MLASGSSGNCSVLRSASSTVLIDAGLSPRRTRACLAEMGLDLTDLDAILLTHLDSDHFHSGWPRALPDGLRVLVHSTHTRQARSRGLSRHNCRSFGDTISLADDYCVFTTLNAHDELGTAAFRFEFVCGASLGFVTDIGKGSDELVEHMRGVDVLAIESNYCPRMQVESDRPVFLKQRVMGGSGHLSNQECAQLVSEIGPRRHVVLLHLSRQCNDPSLAARLHAHRPYALTVTSQFEASPWVEIVRGEISAELAIRPVVRGSLFDQAAGRTA